MKLTGITVINQKQILNDAGLHMIPVIFFVVVLLTIYVWLLIKNTKVSRKLFIVNIISAVLIPIFLFILISEVPDFKDTVYTITYDERQYNKDNLSEYFNIVKEYDNYNKLDITKKDNIKVDLTVK